MNNAIAQSPEQGFLRGGLISSIRRRIKGEIMSPFKRGIKGDLQRLNLLNQQILYLPASSWYTALDCYLLTSQQANTEILLIYLTANLAK